MRARLAVFVAPVVVFGLVAVTLPLVLGSAALGGRLSGAVTGLLDADRVPAEYRRIVADAGKRCEGITAPVIAAQVEAESRWNAAAVSPVGAQGPAQFMPGTWATWGKDYSGDGVADVYDPVDAINSQADFMCSLYGRIGVLLADGRVSGTQLPLALASYNAGLGAVQRYRGMPPFAETTAYVQRILTRIPSFTRAVRGHGVRLDPGGGPGVSADGTYRVPTAGSGELDPATLCRIPWTRGQRLLRCDALDALERLNAAYRARFGSDLGIADAYRNYRSQVRVRAEKERLAAKPGTSNHGWGLALDLAGIGGEGSARHAWLRANAPAYGWQHPTWARSGGSKPEAWHWEYVGAPG